MSGLALPVVAFQVWDAVGWLGQGLFTLRMLGQWLQSERAGRSHVTPSFWWISIAATLALLIYQLHRQDPVFLVGLLVNGAIYVRNLSFGQESAPGSRRRGPLVPLAIALALFAVLTQLSRPTGDEVMRFDPSLPWLLTGFLAQFFWSSRFVLQWYASERAGRSVLPASFFQASIVGAVGLLAYALHRFDYVMIFAYALNPIPYVRNLVLLRREARARESASG